MYEKDMAFDLKFGNKKESIGHHEEGLFQAVNGSDDYPVLNWVWEQYYSSPKIDYDICNKLVHELISLQEATSDKAVSHTISRLLPFFSKAYLSQSQVITNSD